MNNVALVFPGQGSQKVGMAATFIKHPAAKRLFEEADDVLKFNLSKLMFSGEEKELARTVNTQPALLLAGIAALRVLEDTAEKHAYTLASSTAGHSLGEYTALVAAGVLGFADALKLVRLRGQAMQEAVPEGIGKMAAILGLTYAEVVAVSKKAGVYVANDNAEGQVVLSGEGEHIEKACVLAKEAGARRAVVLPVSAPFHCPLVAPAADIMAEAFKAVAFKAPQLPIMSNVKAALATDPQKWPALLTQQITQTVRWRESMAVLAENGITTLLELGSGKVLSGLASRCDKRLCGIPLENVEGIAAYAVQL